MPVLHRNAASDTCTRALADNSCDYDFDNLDGCLTDCGSCDQPGNNGCDYSCDMACTGPNSGCSASCDGDHAYEIYRRCDSGSCDSQNNMVSFSWTMQQSAAATACENYGAGRGPANPCNPARSL